MKNKLSRLRIMRASVAILAIAVLTIASCWFFQAPAEPLEEISAETLNRWQSVDVMLIPPDSSNRPTTRKFSVKLPAGWEEMASGWARTPGDMGSRKCSQVRGYYCELLPSAW